MRATCATRRPALAALLLVAAAPARVPASVRAQDERETTVGMPARIAELVLPGPELEVVPGDASSPLVLRLTCVSPHGSEFRYDLEYWAFEPGSYDLRAWLRRKDGTPTDLAGGDLPAIPVTVSTVLPADRITPHAPPASEVDPFGGYRALLVAGGVAWLAGLLGLLFAGRRRTRALAAGRAQPRSLAERLRPLVERAVAGTLSRTERSQLELGLVAYWRRRLGLDQRQPAEALALLHAHAEAGPLLRALEDWLHRPSPPDEVDIPALLAPYRDLPADALDELDELAGAPLSERR